MGKAICNFPDNNFLCRFDLLTYTFIRFLSGCCRKDNPILTVPARNFCEKFVGLDFYF